MYKQETISWATGHVIKIIEPWHVISNIVAFL